MNMRAQHTVFSPSACQHAIHFCCKLLDLVKNIMLIKCSKFTFPARRINMSYTNDCNKYNVYPFHTCKHFLVTGEIHVSLWRGSTACQTFSLVSFVPYFIHGLTGNRHEQSQHLMHLHTPKPYSHLHGFRFTDWARYLNLTNMSSYNPWHVEWWFMKKYNPAQSSYSQMCTWKQLYCDMNRSSIELLKSLNLKMTPVLHQIGNIIFNPQSKAIKKFDVHHTGKADSLLHWHTSERNFWVRISTSSRTRYSRRSIFVIRQLQDIICLKQGGVEIKISQPFASESCKHSKDNTEVTQGLLSTQWSLTFTHHHKETGNLNSTLHRSKLHLESRFQEENLPHHTQAVITIWYMKVVSLSSVQRVTYTGGTTNGNSHCQVDIVDMPTLSDIVFCYVHLIKYVLLYNVQNKVHFTWTIHFSLLMNKKTLT
jgi:hypothetical protein